MSIVTQLNTALAGRYEIEREIGAGGMATVYLARDLRHDRGVALKLLNPELGAVLGVERFLSEIRVTANLQHPNLLPLFDSGEASGLLFYVMPFVEGESLRARLTREKQLPVDEAVRMGVAIADALDYAHSHGVIHRDLKPENILLQHGQPVIADFGIALAVSNAGGARITQTGLSLGTPQYMSPEQATGDRAIDGRTDVYSLAAMIYEMLVGDPPHTASTSQAIIAKVLTERPAGVRTSRPSVPEHVEDAVARALEKLPADRWATARDFSQALQGKATVLASAARRSTGARGGRWPLAAVVAPSLVAVGAIIAATALWTRSHAPASTEPVRFSFGARGNVSPSDAATWSVTASPDGKLVIFTGKSKEGKRQLYARPIDQLFARPIAGTEEAYQPVVSPDGKWIAFQAANKLWKVPIEGGAPVSIGDLTALNGIDWAPGDVMVLGAMGSTHGLSRISAAGGSPSTVLTQRDTTAKEVDHIWPVVLEDGKTVVFTIWYGALKTSKLAVTSLDNGSTVTTLDVHAIAPLGVFAKHLVYVRADGVVMAVPFDVSARRITGMPVPIENQIAVCNECNGDAKVRISRGGTFVYLTGVVDTRLVWVTERGEETPALGDAKGFSLPRVSPDGKRAVVSVGTATGIARTATGIAPWIVNIATGTMTRIPADTVGGFASWMSDGKSVVYSALGAYYRQPVDGGAAEKLAAPPSVTAGQTVSPNGKSLIYETYPNNNIDLMLVALDKGGATTAFAATDADEMSPSFSPDSRWIAYSSSASGRREVYVAANGSSATRVQVSDAGGDEPVWSRDGKRLFYRDGKKMIAATITTTPSVSVISRTPLFDDKYYGGANWAGYDVSPGGKFLMVKPNSNNIEVGVIANWLTELQRKTATK